MGSPRRAEVSLKALTLSKTWCSWREAARLPASLGAQPPFLRTLGTLFPRFSPAPPYASLSTHQTAHRLVHLIALDRGLDTLVWQLIASVAAPGYTIHTLVAVVTQLLVAAEVGGTQAGSCGKGEDHWGSNPATKCPGLLQSMGGMHRVLMALSATPSSSAASASTRFSLRTLQHSGRTGTTPPSLHPCRPPA